MASEQLSELFARIHAGFRRNLKKGALLSDPGMQELHHRLISIDPAKLAAKPLRDTRFVVIDTETTGWKAYAGDEICSISLIEMHGLEITGKEFNSLINPGRDIPPESTRIHNITDEDVKDAPLIEEVLLDVSAFIGESVLIGHHIGFDIRFLNKTLQKELLCRIKHPWLDTMLLYLASTGRVGHYSLEEVASFTRVPVHQRHTAHGDALTAAEVFIELSPQLVEHRDEPVKKLIQRQYDSDHF